MNIGEAAKRSGLPAKTIRYYEDIDLLRPQRSSNGYRTFRETDLAKLTFVARARSLGFRIDECRKLLALHEDRDRASAEVKQVAREHLGRIDEKIAELGAMRATLVDLIDRCQGNERPDCPIIDGLAGTVR